MRIVNWIDKAGKVQTIKIPTEEEFNNVMAYLKKNHWIETPLGWRKVYN